MSTFNYKYKALNESEREEIESIRRSYLPKIKSSIERLRELDGKVKNTPIITSLSLGIIGVLIFGLGLSMILVFDIIIYGIIVMAIGCIPVGVSYPVYLKIYDKQKNKYQEEILSLSEKLLNEEDE